ncbi:MAG: hypothetical protein ACYCOO_09705 [Chitinophagaceae bacterium]
MKRTPPQQSQKCQEISIEQIFLDHSDYMTLWANLKLDDSWQFFFLGCDYEILNKIMMGAGKTGDDILMRVVEGLEKLAKEGESAEDVPLIIDLEEIYGEGVVFNHVELSLVATQNLEEEGNTLVENVENLLFIDRVEARGVAMLKDVRQENHQEVALEGLLAKCMVILIKSYSLYLGYKELDFEDDYAREKAELEDDIKFKMAYYAWQEGEGKFGLKKG